jgi:hypothetical protein
MKATMIIGILLLIGGVVVLINEGFTYTSREEVLDIGPIEAHTETEKTVPISPILGGLAVAGGIALVLAGARH